MTKFRPFNPRIWFIGIIIPLVIGTSGCSKPSKPDETTEDADEAQVTEETPDETDLDQDEEDDDTDSMADISAEEYTPPTGVAAYLPQESDGPGPRRILLATSTDGLTFTRSNIVLLDQANTPNMLVLSSGRIIVYYTGYKIDGGTKDGIGAAVSDDHGASWRYFKVGMDGFGSSYAPIGDPDIVSLGADGYRMYVTNGSSDGSEIHIISTTSSDGFQFTKEGVSLDVNSTDYKDSLTQKVGSGYVMFVLKSLGTRMKRAVSSDGVTFSDAGDADFTQSGGNYVLSNWYDSGSGSYRIFAFGPPYINDIRSWTTTDGISFTADSTVSLAFESSNPLEATFVKDAAIGKLNDGTYLMAYVSEIP